MSDPKWPEWFQYIRVRQRTILGSSLPPDFLVSFGPQNICTPQKTEKRAEMLAEEIKHWLWMFMGKERAETERLRTALERILTFTSGVPDSALDHSVRRAQEIARQALEEK